jgi:tetratricopeptide (TPR) repeat protein
MLPDDEAALEEYRAIIKRDPDFFIAYLSLGRVLSRLGQLDQAEAVYQQAQARTQGEPIRQAWINLDQGQLHERKGEVDLAIAAYQQAIGLAPTLETPYFFLAQLYKQQGTTDGAYLNFRKLSEISQNPSWAHALFADYLAGQQNYPEAIAEYKRALLFPAFDDAKLYAELGKAYAYADEADFPDKEALSLAAFAKAVQAPGPYEAYIRSIYGQILYFNFHIIEEAIRQHLLSLEADASIGVETRLNLGQIYQDTREFAKAREQYQILIDAADQIPADRLKIAQERLQTLEE